MGHSTLKNGHFFRPAATVLPDLSSLEPTSLRTITAEEKTALILQLLRDAAQKSRNEKSQPFYSIRTVASYFEVPVTTVSRIYARLKDEGLLASVWGSKTFVEPAQIDKQLHFRAVVGMPASLKLFCTVPAYRTFHLSISDALWKLGFAAQLIFYEGRDSEESTLANHFSSHKMDIVIWFLSGPKSKNTASCLADRGVRLITVVDSLRSSSEPCYYLSRQRALREGLIAWQRDGITSVTVARQTSCESFDRLEMIETCLRELEMHYTIVHINSCPHPLRTVSRRKNGAIIFPCSEFFVQSATQDSAGCAKLLAHSRVMSVGGPVDLPSRTGTDTTFDVIEFDWPTVAKRMACDLLEPVRSTTDYPITFEAMWLPGRRPLRRHR
jgi:hypothetical protein